MLVREFCSLQMSGGRGAGILLGVVGLFVYVYIRVMDAHGWLAQWLSLCLLLVDAGARRPKHFACVLSFVPWHL